MFFFCHCSVLLLIRFIGLFIKSYVEQSSGALRNIHFMRCLHSFNFYKAIRERNANKSHVKCFLVISLRETLRPHTSERSKTWLYGGKFPRTLTLFEEWSSCTCQHSWHGEKYEEGYIKAKYFHQFFWATLFTTGIKRKLHEMRGRKARRRGATVARNWTKCFSYVRLIQRTKLG